MLRPLRGNAVTFRLLVASLCLAGFASSSASTPNPIYFGGSVVSHAIVVPVNWNSDVDSTLQDNLPQFYTDLVQSGFWDLLAQYSTVGVTPQDALAGSGQLIARGSATAGITLIPVKCAAGAGSLLTPCPVTEADIDDEINRQIDLDILPAPSLDATGNVDTVYLLNFPPRVQVVLGTAPSTQTSCVDFCSANTTLLRNALNIGVGIVMDYAQTGCASGCGSDATPLALATRNASTALVDVVTDPELNLAASIARPLAWYDVASGQVADYCGTNSNTATSSDGVRVWTVGEIWSGETGACTVSHNQAFSITSSPTGVVVNQGGTVPVSIATGSRGYPGSITLETSALPAGLGAAFDTSVVAAGASTTLQLSADLAAAPATLRVDVGGMMSAPYDVEVGSFTLTVRANEIFAGGFD